MASSFGLVSVVGCVILFYIIVACFFFISIRFVSVFRVRSDCCCCCWPSSTNAISPDLLCVSAVSESRRARVIFVGTERERAKKTRANRFGYLQWNRNAIDGINTQTRNHIKPSSNTDPQYYIYHSLHHIFGKSNTHTQTHIHTSGAQQNFIK